MEKQASSRKSLLMMIVAVVVLAAMLTMTFVGCGGGQTDPTTDTTNQGGANEGGNNADEAAKLYWNVDRKESAGKRQPGSDGAYQIVFAQDGKQVTLRVADKALVETIDSMDMMGLEVDDKGNVTKVISLKDLGYKEQAVNYYVAGVKSGVVQLKENQDLSGEESMFKLEAFTQVLDISGVSGEVGAKTTIQDGDGVTVVIDENGDAIFVYVVDRQPPAVTVKKLCEHCKKEVDFIGWNKTGSLPTTDGHYYLENDIQLTNTSGVAEGAVICLDLNGKTVTAAAEKRAYTVGKGSILTIMDSTKDQAGKFVAVGKQLPNGGLILTSGTLNIYAGTYDASKATSTGNGTCIAINGGAVFNMYGGKVLGGTSQKNSQGQFGCAGSVQIEQNGVFNLYDGEVKGGKAYNTGGQIRVIGTMNMHGGRVSGGYCFKANGGNISVARMGVLNLGGGYVLDGICTNNAKGGNIYSEGKILMNDGFVDNGIVVDVNGNIVADHPARNVYHRNQSFEMYGGIIKGYVQVADASATDTYNTSIYVAGLANISGAPEGHKNLSWGTGVNFRVGKLLKGSKVSVDAGMGQTLVARGTMDDAAWAGYKTIVDNGSLVCDNPNAVLAVLDDAIVVTDVNAVMRCICGNLESTGNPCADGGHKEVPFSAWDNATSLPTTGNYYLTKDVVLSAQCDVVGGTAASPSTLTIDLCGKTISVSGGIRAFAIASQHTIFNLVDSVGGGKIDYTSTNNAPWFGFGIQLNAANSTVNMYGGTITGERNATTGGAGLIMGSGCNAETSVFNMYGGEITGGYGAKGGNVFMHLGTFNLYSGLIAGGEASTNGGNFWLNNLGGSAEKCVAILNVYGGEIKGGEAASGASIYLNNGAMANISGGKITGCTTTGKVAPIHVGAGSDLVVSGGEITGNSTDEGTGAVRVEKGASLIVSADAKITDNTAANVYLMDGALLTVGEDGLATGESGAMIGVAMEKPGIFSTNAVEDGVVACFKSNSLGYKVIKNSNNMLALIPGDDNEETDATKYCLCGDPTSVANPCADGGHIQYTWTAWEKEDSLPTVSGKYYLTKDVTLAEALKVTEATIYLDLAGKNITATGNAIELAGGVMAITETSGNGGKIDGTVEISGDAKLTFLRAELKELKADAGEAGLYSGKIATVNGAGAIILAGNINIDKLIVPENGNVTVDEENLLTGNGGAKIGVAVANKDEYFIYGPFSGIVLNVFSSVEEGYAVSNEAEGLRMRPDGEVWHCLCGDPSSDDKYNPCAKEGHKSIRWTAAETLPEPAAGEQYIWLTEGYTFDKPYKLADGQKLTIDLNGNKFSLKAAHFFDMSAGDGTAVLTITDSKGGGTLDMAGSTGTYGGVIILNKGEANLYAGNFTNTDSSKYLDNGALVCMGSSSTATFNMYGGTLSGGKTNNQGANVSIKNNAKFNMYGGVIKDGVSNNGGGNVNLMGSSEFKMYEGTIDNGKVGTASGRVGGNVRIIGGTFELHGGNITGGEAQQGGSVYVKGAASYFKMYDGTISGYNGGASGTVCVTGNSTMEMSGGSITGNKSTYKGGAVLLWNGNLKMTGGIISGNQSPNSAGNVHLQENSTLTVSQNAQITGNTGPNVYLSTGKFITIGEGGIGTSRVGVTMQTPGNFTNTAVAMGIFSSDSANFEVAANADGTLKLVAKAGQ